MFYYHVNELAECLCGNAVSGFLHCVKLGCVPQPTQTPVGGIPALPLG